MSNNQELPVLANPENLRQPASSMTILAILIAENVEVASLNDFSNRLIIDAGTNVKQKIEIEVTKYEGLNNEYCAKTRHINDPHDEATNKSLEELSDSRIFALSELEAADLLELYWPLNEEELLAINPEEIS